VTAATSAQQSSLSEAPPPVLAPLTLLSQGPETAQLYRELFAAYLVIPSSDEEELATELSVLELSVLKGCTTGTLAC